MTYLSGFDIGGTKCSVSVGRQEADGTLTILAKNAFRRLMNRRKH